ncbi:hypothetical protein SDC9_212071 [bioreactor metagenome]|uniref:Uncharacterized protein n=1 Tax=bioreactor metagenome TaxID=1076179 RepID=A0A645JMI6_9ZZZZ
MRHVCDQPHAGITELLYPGRLWRPRKMHQVHPFAREALHGFPGRAGFGLRSVQWAGIEPDDIVLLAHPGLRIGLRKGRECWSLKQLVSAVISNQRCPLGF